MKTPVLNKYSFAILVIIALLAGACNTNTQMDLKTVSSSSEENKAAFEKVMTKHLNAITNKDTVALRATLSPKGNMELIQSQTEIIYTANAFMKTQAAWFQEPNWTFETKILSMDVGERLGVATTETIYREPERDGKPYFNRMNISYTLEKTDGQWYIIKDHASSVERSTDIK